MKQFNIMSARYDWEHDLQVEVYSEHLTAEEIIEKLWETDFDISPSCEITEILLDEEKNYYYDFIIYITHYDWDNCSCN